MAVQYTREEQFKIFPNPLNGNTFYLIMNGTEGEEVLIVLYNTLGETVYSKTIIQQDGSMATTINLLNHLTPGTYFVVGSNSNVLFRQKLVVK